MKRLLAVITAMVVSVSCSMSVLAAVVDHDIDSGDLEVDADNVNEDGYRVYSSSGNTSSHKIVVSGVKTTITLDNVNIETDSESAIKIGDDANVTLKVEGENSLSVVNGEYEAGISISGGKLTISGSDVTEDTLNVTNTGSHGAAIGSDGDENFTGTITINSGVTVNAGSDVGTADGAGIGSGEYGDMSGNIIINKGSVVNAASQDRGAAIGSGEDGEMSGTVTINGGTVSAVADDDDGAGIGSGEDGKMSGTITINGGDVTAISGEDGAGIGSGGYGEMSGTIIINGGNVEASSDSYGAGIGSGDYGEMSGTIIITGGNVTATSEYDEIGIGSGDDGEMSGTITIGGNVSIELGENQIGSNYDGIGDALITIEKGSTINGLEVESVEQLENAGILNGNVSARVVEKNTINSSSFTLGKLSIVQRIEKAKAGESVVVAEKQLSKSKVPYYVLETLAAANDVTLVIVCEDGSTVEINSKDVPEKGKHQFYTVEELK